MEGRSARKGIPTHLAAEHRGRSWGRGSRVRRRRASLRGRVLKGAAAEDPGVGDPRVPELGVGEDRAGAAQSLISQALAGMGTGPLRVLEPSLRARPRASALARLPFPSPRRDGSRRLSQALEESQPVPGARVRKEKEEKQ